MKVLGKKLFIQNVKRKIMPTRFSAALSVTRVIPNDPLRLCVCLKLCKLNHVHEQTILFTGPVPLTKPNFRTGLAGR